ncbi:MAG TPA: hypothetical protein VM840_10300 [Actinomycetota bacterium]|nr:hypothetical protein [Actinomycetota bacterium]
MSSCTSCGNRLPPGATTCPACGAVAFPASTANLRPLGIGEIVDVGIKIFTRNFKPLVVAVAVVVVPVQVLASFISVSAGGFQDFTAFTQPPTGEVPVVHPRDLATMAVGGFFVTVLGLISTQLATGASFKAVSDAYLGSTADWRSSLGFAVARLGPLVWLGLLVFMLIGGIVVAGVAVGAALGLAALGAGAGLFLLFVPLTLGMIAAVVYLAVVWSVAVPALLFEDRRGREALRRSKHLVRGFFITTAVVLLLSLIIRAVVGGIFGGIFALLFRTVGDTALAQFLLSLVVGAGSSVLTTPFAAAILAVLYFDLRVRKEGFDLELLIARMGGPDAAAPTGRAPDPWDPFAAPPERDQTPRLRPPDPDGPTWESR